MARRILRDFKEASINQVRNDLDNYLSRGRAAYLEMLNTIKPNSDIIIDGTLSAEVIVTKIYDGIVQTITTGKELKELRYSKIFDA